MYPYQFLLHDPRKEEYFPVDTRTRCSFETYGVLYPMKNMASYTINWWGMRHKPKNIWMGSYDKHWVTLHSKAANSYSCKVNNSADVKRDTLLQFHTIILNELSIGICPGSVSPNRHEVKSGEGRGVTPLSDLNRDVRPDRVWFSQGFVLNVVRVYF